jgi:hypothetical protein
VSGRLTAFLVGILAFTWWLYWSGRYRVPTGIYLVIAIAAFAVFVFAREA